MSNTQEKENAELSEKESQESLENLSDSERKETEEIIDEINKESKDSKVDEKSEDDDSSKDHGESQDKKKEEKSEDQDSDKDKEKVDDDERRDTKSVPSYMLGIARKEWAQEKTELTNKINNLESKLAQNKGQDSAENDKAVDDGLDDIAKKHNIKPELLKDIAEEIKKGVVPPDLSQQLDQLKKLNEDQEVKAEELHFNDSFDKFVLPLVKSEYGENVSSDTINEIKSVLKEKAYTDQYQATPYSVIYKGLDEFRKYERPKSGPEGSRGGFDQSGQGSSELDFSKVTEEDLAKMDEKTLDAYMIWAEKNERKNS